MMLVPIWDLEIPQQQEEYKAQASLVPTNKITIIITLCNITFFWFLFGSPLVMYLLHDNQHVWSPLKDRISPLC